MSIYYLWYYSHKYLLKQTLRLVRITCVECTMDVVIINAAQSADGNSAYIADRFKEKYPESKRFDLCSFSFDPSYRIKKDDGRFRPEFVEEGLREAMTAVHDADLIIFVAPNYFSFISGTAKLFLDKFYVFLNKSGRPTFEKSKKMFFVLTQASVNRSHGQSTLDWMKGFSNLFDMKFFGITVPNCRGREPEGAKMKMDEISMSLNMFI